MVGITSSQFSSAKLYTWFDNFLIDSRDFKLIPVPENKSPTFFYLRRKKSVFFLVQNDENLGADKK